MVHIINISDARKNISSLIKKVATTKEPIIIIQDSKPMAIINAYGETDDLNEKLRTWKIELEEVLHKGKKILADSEI